MKYMLELYGLVSQYDRLGVYRMNIHGLQKTTLLDYPGHVAATLFTGGCNFRCPFCHNGNLVLNPGSQPEIPMEEIMFFLEKRQGILDGVCITGGEPTLQPDLEDFIKEIRSLGYLVKLDTNGYRPKVLEKLLENGLLDYVAMDIKASKENYAKTVGLDKCVGQGTNESVFALESIERSVELLKNSEIDYEFRTTVVKGLHTPEEFEKIGRWLAGCKAYYLQAYQENENVLVLKEGAGEIAGQAFCFGSFSHGEMEEMAALAGKYIGKVLIRGVE